MFNITNEIRGTLRQLNSDIERLQAHGVTCLTAKGTANLAFYIKQKSALEECLKIINQASTKG